MVIAYRALPSRLSCPETVGDITVMILDEKNIIIQATKRNDDSTTPTESTLHLTQSYALSTGTVYHGFGLHYILTHQKCIDHKNKVFLNDYFKIKQLAK